MFNLNFIYSPTEIIQYSDRLAEFQNLNTEVIGVSVDSEHAHLAWINTPRENGGLGETQIPLVSDINKTIAKSYGVLLDKGYALRGTFIIDDKGILRQITVNDLDFGRNIDETLRLIEAAQWSDGNQVVCPMGWKKGDKTMIGIKQKWILIL